MDGSIQRWREEIRSEGEQLHVVGDNQRRRGMIKNEGGDSTLWKQSEVGGSNHR